MDALFNSVFLTFSQFKREFYSIIYVHYLSLNSVDSAFLLCQFLQWKLVKHIVCLAIAGHIHTAWLQSCSRTTNLASLHKQRDLNLVFEHWIIPLQKSSTISQLQLNFSCTKERKTEKIYGLEIHKWIILNRIFPVKLPQLVSGNEWMTMRSYSRVIGYYKYHGISTD